MLAYTDRLAACAGRGIPDESGDGGDPAMQFAVFCTIEVREQHDNTTTQMVTASSSP